MIFFPNPKAIRTVIQTVKFDAQEGPARTLTWFGHRRLAIANSYSKFLTVVLIPTNYDTEYNMDNVKIAAMCRKASMGKAENLMNKTVCLRYVLKIFYIYSFEMSTYLFIYVLVKDGEMGLKGKLNTYLSFIFLPNFRHI